MPKPQLTQGSTPLNRICEKGLIIAKPYGLFQGLLGGGVIASMGVFRGA